MENINNKAYIAGKIVSDFEYSHQTHGENFYLFDVSTVRTSGYADIIPVMISERLIDINQSYIGQHISVTGQFRSYNQHEKDRVKLVLSVFAQDYELTESDVVLDNFNQIELIGYLCKNPSYRKTPLGREITDMLLAVNRPYNKSDYIPCITWGRNARFVSGIAVGSKVKVSGRIQSREYNKKISDEEVETRIAYEVSISKVEVLDEE